MKRNQFASIKQDKKVDPAGGAVILAFIAWFVSELVAVVTHNSKATFSYQVWSLMGDRYSLRWFCSMGFLAGLFLWSFWHFGWEKPDWPELIVMVGCGIFVSAMLYMTTQRIT